MISLTPRQSDLLTFIRSYLAEHGTAPSYEQMRVAIGASSKSAISRLIDGLESRGAIRREHGKDRALEVIADSLERYTVTELRAELERRAGQ